MYGARSHGIEAAAGWTSPGEHLYFSNWSWNVGATLLYDAPESCVLRVKADAETFDADWTLRYSDIAESRQGAMFANLGEGRALMSVFHEERVQIDETTAGADLVSTPSGTPAPSLPIT